MVIPRLPPPSPTTNLSVRKSLGSDPPIPTALPKVVTPTKVLTPVTLKLPSTSKSPSGTIEDPKICLAVIIPTANVALLPTTALLPLVGLLVPIPTSPDDVNLNLSVGTISCAFPTEACGLVNILYVPPAYSCI